VTTVSTHILDTAHGGPAAGVPVGFDLWAGNAWQRLGDAVTGPDGRITGFPPVEGDAPAYCRLLFAVDDYLVTHYSTAFFPEITVAFVAEHGEHYHVPLLLSPFGYSTYRGS
jgi:5-hydroxyisourate hydrolase